MAGKLTLSLTSDEAEILVDALEADLEGYLESAKEARGNNRRAEVATFTEAAERIQALLSRVQALVEYLIAGRGCDSALPVSCVLHPGRILSRHAGVIDGL
jgi:hypothetical protein